MPDKLGRIRNCWLWLTLVLWFSLIAPGVLMAAPRYTVQNICPDFTGVANGIDINDVGQVVLAFDNYGWNGIELYTPGQGYEFVIQGGAYGLNNAGQVVGQAGEGAYLWSHQQGAQTLPGVDGGHPEVGYDINNLGQIVGVARNPANELRTVRWDGPTSITDLTTLPGWHSSDVEGGDLTKINDAGLMTGTVWVTDKGLHGALFTGKGWILIDTLIPEVGCSYPLGINNKGEVVGTCDTRPGGGNRHPFYWFDGKIRDLGGLPDYPEGEARGINEAGQIVGVCYQEDASGGFDSRAVIWTSEGIADLNSLVTNLPAGEQLRTAAAINNSGQIIGQGLWSNFLFLLTPVAPFKPGFGAALNLLLLSEPPKTALP
jgi:probable HAF family extracellular repeat protein